MPEEGAVQGGVLFNVDEDMSSPSGVWRLHSRGRPPAQPCAASQVGAASGYVLMNPGSLGKYKQTRPWMTNTFFSLYMPSLMI